MKLEIIHEDDVCIVINKPAGLAVQGGKGVKNSLDRILAETRSPPPLLVHRLDKDTSGLILVAKTRESAARFSRLFGEDRNPPRQASSKVPSPKPGIVKQYIAICLGCPVKKTGIINIELEIRGGMKKSETKYKVLKSGDLEGTEFSVLELELCTGRMHQIRRHLSMTGNPILGDDKYGDFASNKIFRKSIRLNKLLLHSYRIVIPSAADGFHLDLCAPPPEYFTMFTEGLNLP